MQPNISQRDGKSLHVHKLSEREKLPAVMYLSFLSAAAVQHKRTLDLTASHTEREIWPHGSRRVFMLCQYCKASTKGEDESGGPSTEICISWQRVSVFRLARKSDLISFSRLMSRSLSAVANGIARPQSAIRSRLGRSWQWCKCSCLTKVWVVPHCCK